MTRETLMLRAQSLLPNLPQETLEFACDLVLEQICNYCNLTEAPDGLTNTAALMVRGLVNSVQLQNENMQPAAKGVSRGDTSFPLQRRQSSWRHWQARATSSPTTRRS